MRYYVETVTHRKDGSEFWDRVRCSSYLLAKVIARAAAETGFPEQVDKSCDFQLGTAPTLINDFGEEVVIRATAFGELAQVREGCFTIGEENVPRRNIRRR